MVELSSRACISSPSWFLFISCRSIAVSLMFVSMRLSSFEEIILFPLLITTVPSTVIEYPDTSVCMESLKVWVYSGDV